MAIFPETGVFNGMSAFGSIFITTLTVSFEAMLEIVSGLSKVIQLTLGKLTVTLPVSPAPSL